MNFRFRERDGPTTLVFSISSGMKCYADPKVYLTGPDLYYEYSENEIRNVLDRLIPWRAHSFVSSRIFKDIAFEK